MALWQSACAVLLLRFKLLLLLLLLLLLTTRSAVLRVVLQGLAGQRVWPAAVGDDAAGIHLHLHLLCAVQVRA
jgi:hypothetical protein